MPQPRDPARASSAPRQTKKTTDPAHRPRPPQGPITAREWDVAHAAALRALLSEAPAVLPKQVGDPLLPLRVGIWDALVALLRPGAEPEALARALRAYTRSTGYFMACARKDGDAHDLDGRAVEPGQRGASHGSPEGRSGAATSARSFKEGWATLPLRLPCPRSRAACAVAHSRECDCPILSDWRGGLGRVARHRARGLAHTRLSHFQSKMGQSNLPHAY